MSSTQHIYKELERLRYILDSLGGDYDTIRDYILRNYRIYRNVLVHGNLNGSVRIKTIEICMFYKRLQRDSFEYWLGYSLV